MNDESDDTRLLLRDACVESFKRRYRRETARFGAVRRGVDEKSENEPTV